MKVIITGATGMVGKGVLLECIDHPAIKQVLSIGRTPLGMAHPKLKELIHPNFLDFSAVKEQLKGYDACYLCMGVSAGGMKENTYHVLTYVYTLTLAKLLLEQNPGMICAYVSGQGTDSTENGRVMWARVKGETENALLNLGFNQAYMFRPGVIIPLRGIKSKTKNYQFVYNHFMWLIRLIKAIAPNVIVNTTQIGKSMIKISMQDYDHKIIHSKDILLLAE